MRLYTGRKVRCTLVQTLRLCTGRTVKCTLVQTLRLCTGRTVNCTLVQALRLYTGRTVKCTLLQALRFCTGGMVNCTLVQALRLCTGCPAHMAIRGIGLDFLDPGIRRGEGSASRPGSSLPPGKTWYPLYRRLGGPQCQSGQVWKISPPTGIRSAGRPASC
jgi:hypothetical protein